MNFRGEGWNCLPSFACPGVLPQLWQSICQEQPIIFQATVVPRQPKLQTQKQALSSRKKHEDGGRGVKGERVAQDPLTCM